MRQAGPEKGGSKRVKKNMGLPLWAQWVNGPACLCGGPGSIPGLKQRVKHLALLQLWCELQPWLGFRPWPGNSSLSAPLFLRSLLGRTTRSLFNAVSLAEALSATANVANE